MIGLCGAYHLRRNRNIARRNVMPQQARHAYLQCSLGLHEIVILLSFLLFWEEFGDEVGHVCGSSVGAIIAMCGLLDA